MALITTVHIIWNYAHAKVKSLHLFFMGTVYETIECVHHFIDDLIMLFWLLRTMNYGRIRLYPYFLSIQCTVHSANRKILWESLIIIQYLQAIVRLECRMEHLTCIFQPSDREWIVLYSRLLKMFLSYQNHQLVFDSLSLLFIQVRHYVNGVD